MEGVTFPPGAGLVGRSDLLTETNAQRFFSMQAKALIVSGIVLVLALVWNQTFEVLFTRLFGPKDRFIVQFFYAILVTLALVGVLGLVLRWKPT